MFARATHHDFEREQERSLTHALFIHDKREPAPTGTVHGLKKAPHPMATTCVRTRLSSVIGLIISSIHSASNRGTRTVQASSEDTLLAEGVPELHLRHQI